MPRITTTVDDDLERRLRDEARRRRITRARLLREAAIHYLGVGDGGHELEQLRMVVADQERRLKRLERRLSASPPPGHPAAAPGRPTPGDPF